MSLARAIETGDLALLPGRRDEDWRWTDLRGAIRVMPPRAPLAQASRPGPFATLEAADQVTIVNGLGPTSLNVPAGEATFLELRFVAETEGTADVADFHLNVGSQASVLIVESYEGAPGHVGQVNLRLTLEAGAEVERIVLVDQPDDAILVTQADVVLSPSARFQQTVVTGGSKRQRIETQVRHPGEGASARLDGVYLVGGARHADLTSVVDHEGLGGTTSQLTKGAVAGAGRGVFQGRIVVQRGADKTDARMGHHALILSDRGEIDAKPELLIFADDVSCAHGATVGALDEDALFYACQRGIPEAEARAMLTEAFVGEVIDRIVHDDAREIVRAWVGETLRGLA